MNTPGRLGIVDAFEAAWQRRATPEEADRLYRVQSILGVKDNDAILVLMVALEHYQGLYSAMPARIEEALVDLAECVRFENLPAHGTDCSEANR